jgi:hypothetical protein
VQQVLKVSRVSKDYRESKASLEILVRPDLLELQARLEILVP